MKLLLIIFSLVILNPVLASPEIKGTPEELKQYLTSIPKVITIEENTERLVVSQRARVKLLVETDSKLLSEALKNNFSIRKLAKENLAKLGISKSMVSESKFSYTPEYGLFSDLPKSYTVKNILSIVVTSEEQLISIANISDTNNKIRYLSVKPMIADKDKIYAELHKKALDLVKEKALFYESRLGLKLVPIFVDDAKSNVLEQNRIGNRSSFKKSIVSSTSSGYTKSNQSFGEEKLKVSVLVNYKVLSNQ